MKGSFKGIVASVCMYAVIGLVKGIKNMKANHLDDLKIMAYGETSRVIGLIELINEDGKYNYAVWELEQCQKRIMKAKSAEDIYKEGDRINEILNEVKSEH